MLYHIIALVFFCPVFITGLIGNGLLILIVCRQRELRTIPNLLVVSSAFGDFLFVLFCVPFGVVAYSFDSYPFPEYYCSLENFIINLSLGVSVFSLLALSADRYKIIAKPFSCHANDPTIRIKIIVTFIWLFSALFALPEMIYSGLITELIESNNKTMNMTYCSTPNRDFLLENSTFMITRQLLRSIIYYLMPFVFITIFYSLIAKTLLQTKDVIYFPNSSSFTYKNEAAINGENDSLNNNIRQHNGSFSTNQKTNTSNQDIRTIKQLHRRRKVAKTVLFLCVAFFICWLPKQLHDLYWFIGVHVYSSPWTQFWHINKIIALILTYIYSCINPFALYFLSSTFRHYYKRYLCFCLYPYSNENTQRRSTRESLPVPNAPHRSSFTNSSVVVYYDLKRVKTLDPYQRQSH